MNTSDYMAHKVLILSKKYKVPYDVIAFCLNISKATVYRILKRNKNMRLKEIEETIKAYNLFGKMTMSEYE